ncbi:MAG: cation-transporting P-type ATPase [Clostridia bacterium]|nr:cation-transporting P-type ATPase [Clostridia bacterium]
MSRYANIRWHTMTAQEVIETLKTDRYRGLSNKLARKRKERIGENGLFSPARSTVRDALHPVLHDAPLLLLLLVCLVALCFSLWRSVICVLFILILSSILTATAYAKTRHIRESMSAYSIPRVEVIRAGKICKAHAAALVPGDVIRLRRGDIVPADARLLYLSSTFSVRTLRGYDQGIPVFEDDLYKDADVLYTAENDVPDALQRANMLFAGSRIREGSAVALVVATGEDTYHGALSGPHALAADVGEMPYLSRMRRYVNRYSLIMCAILLPATLIGLLFGESSLFEVFLVVLSLTVASMSEQLMVMGRIVAACGVIRAALPADRAASALIKNYHAADRIGRLRHVFLTDMSAFSDGIMHPHAIFTDDRIYDMSSAKCPAVLRFYTLAYLYGKCTEGSLTTLGEDTDHAEKETFAALLCGVGELSTRLSFDTESMEIRTLSAELAKDGSGDALVCLRLRGGGTRDVRIVCTMQEEIIGYCVGRTVGDTVEPMDEDAKKLFYEACIRLREDGCRVLFYATRDESGLTLEGMIGLREAVDPDAAEKLAQLARHHVRVSVLLQNPHPCDLALLRQSGLLNDGETGVCAREISAKELIRLYEAQEQSCVFTEVKPIHAKALIEHYQAQKMHCAAVGFDYNSHELLDAADVAISYDNTRFRSDGATNAGKPIPLDRLSSGARGAGRGDAAVVADSDLLVRRGSEKGGALDGILGAVRTARAIEKNMALMLQYMLVTQFLRMTPVLLSLLFGGSLLSPSLLLVSGMWVDLGFILLLAFRRGGEDELLLPARSARLFDAPVKERPDRVVAAVMSGILILTISAILLHSGVLLNTQQQMLFVFLSLLFVQTTAILLFYFGGGERDERPLQAHLPIFGMLLIVLLPPLIMLCIPSVASVLGCASMTLPILLLSAGAMVLYPILCYVCAKLRFRMRRFLRKHFSIGKS